jgi:hypothetical protein
MRARTPVHTELGSGYRCRLNSDPDMGITSNDKQLY